jgi:hypothetical protein
LKERGRGGVECGSRRAKRDERERKTMAERGRNRQTGIEKKDRLVWI